MNSTPKADGNTPRSHFYLTAWRWHFYAGLFVVPFMLILAVTGIAMMYIGYIDGRDGEKISVQVPENASYLSLEQQQHIAEQQFPGSHATQWIHPLQADRASVFRVAPASTPEQQMMVAVDPYRGTVLESWGFHNGWYDLADNIHGTLLLGDTGDRILETAAGFGIILLITGLYLWWPDARSVASALLPDLRARGRRLWKELHLSLGLWSSVFLLLFLLSGMSWTGIWGGKMVQAWSTFPAEKWDNIPLSDETHASLNAGGTHQVPWALEQTPMPASGSAAGNNGVPAGQAINLSSIRDVASAQGLQGRYRVAYPDGPTGVWTITQDTMSSDAQDPFSDRTIHLDQYSGRILANMGFADYSLAGKTMAVSIPLHMGLVSVWNLAFNTVICLMIIMLCVSGVVMWWKRRPAGHGLRLAAPKAPQQRPRWTSAMVVMIVVSLAFPLTGAVLLAVLLSDWLMVSRIPALRRAFS